MKGTLKVTRRAGRTPARPLASSTAPGRPSPGRPRSDAAHSAILEASIALIRDFGFDAVTMEGIAARAGVGKATIYRRWTSRELLVAEAIRHVTQLMPMPDTGSTTLDLHSVMRGTLGMYQDPASAALLSGLVAAMARSDVIAEAVRSGFVATRRGAMRTVLTRGMVRGDLRADLDVELTIDMLSGPLLVRLLVTGAPIDERLATSVVDMVLRASALGSEKVRR